MAALVAAIHACCRSASTPCDVLLNKRLTMRTKREHMAAQVEQEGSSESSGPRKVASGSQRKISASCRRGSTAERVQPARGGRNHALPRKPDRRVRSFWRHRRWDAFYSLLLQACS